MIIYASDYKGIQLRKELFKNAKGNEIEDIGIPEGSPLDYIDISKSLAKKITNDDFGIIICGSGQGVAIALNRYPHIRATPCRTVEDALDMRRRLNANVLCIGSQQTNFEEAEKIVNAFINADFAHGKHEMCVNKLGSHITTHAQNGINVIVRAIIEHKGHVLFTTATDDNKEFSTDCYFLPGGHVDYQESSIDALKREIYEEMNINVRAFHFTGSLECCWDRNGKPYHEINMVYRVDVKEELSLSQPPKPVDNGFHKFVWLPKERIKDIKILPNSLNKIILKKEADFYSEMAA